MTSATYREPYQFSAGVLALLVHGAFFAVLYFGLSWQSKPPMEAMSVELWDAVPVPAGVPAGGLSPDTAALAPTLVEPPPPPIEVVKPEIVVPAEKPPKPVPIPPKTVTKPTRTVQKPAESNRKNPQSLLERYGIEGGNRNTPRGGGRVGQQLRLADAVKATELERLLAEYVSKIKAKIKRYIVMPPDVPEDARVEFLVTLLPDGSVMSVRLARSSHLGYANAVERAIIKAQPLPLPPDSELFGQFRELKLVFKPVE